MNTNTQGELAISDMFQTIMITLQKSQKDIEELKQEYGDLKTTNASLEHQIREGLNNHGGPLGSRTPGYMTPPLPSNGSSQQHSKSPFLSPNLPNVLSSQIPYSYTYRHPSPLTDQSLILSSSPFKSREIPGFYVVIPAGGAGTRLWPLSRENHPKFLLDLTLKGRSLIQATWDRLIPLSSHARTTVVAGPSHTKTIREQLPDLAIENIFTEPGPKDSMAAIGLAAAVLAIRDPDAIIGSFAADHMISGDDAFLAAVAEAVEVAKKDFLVTIGIAPSGPSTAFGYIGLGKSLGYPEAPNAMMVDSFKEKPDAITASNYLQSGQYRWNAGMFVIKAKFLLELLTEYKPKLAAGLMKIGEAWDDPLARAKVLAEVWPTLEKIPIDNAVAEPAAATRRVAVVPATFGWDDVGDFSSLSELLPGEKNQTRILGDNSLVLTEQVYGGIVVPGSGRLISCLGVDDLVIVDMPDTLLITTRARSQEVKRIVKKARDAGWASLL